MEKRKGLLCIIVGITIMSIFVLGGNASAKEKYFFSIASGSTAGTFFPMMAAVGEIMTNEVPEIKNATAQTTGASFENVRLMQKGYVQFAMTNAASMYAGYHGKEPFKERLDKLRTIFWGHGSDLHLMTLKDSGIKTWKDIRGKRFAVGGPGSGGETEIRRVIELDGMSYKDFKIRFVGYGPGMDALRDRRVDVTLASTGIPVPRVMDLTISRPIHFISLPEYLRDRVVKEYPVYQKFTIPAGTYKGQDYDVKTLTSPATFSCIAEVPEDIVYKVTKAIYKKVPWLIENVHVSINRWRFDPDIKVLAPLHPGAVRFYKEMGKM